jgi:prenyltransferase beta subunit
MSLFDDTSNMIKQLLDAVMQQVTITNEVAYLEDNVSKIIRTRVTAELCSTLVKMHNLKISDHKLIIKKLTKWLIDNQNENGSWNETHIKYDKPSTVFTAVCGLTLLEVSESFPDLGIDDDIFERVAKFILNQEINSGAYRKSELVHADILNADAMAAVFLLKYGDKSSNENYVNAGTRAVANICSHQFIDGSFPYSGPLRAYPYKYHFYIPCIHYQAVTLYYLIKTTPYIKSEWLEHSILSGTKWLMKNQKNDGYFKWKNSGLNFALYLSGTYAFAIPVYQKNLANHTNASTLIKKSMNVLNEQMSQGILLRWEKGSIKSIIKGFLEAPKGGLIGNYPIVFTFLRIMHRLYREVARSKISDKITPSKLISKPSGYSAYLGTVESSTNHPDMYMTTEALDALSYSLEGMKNK